MMARCSRTFCSSASQDFRCVATLSPSGVALFKDFGKKFVLSSYCLLQVCSLFVRSILEFVVFNFYRVYLLGLKAEMFDASSKTVYRRSTSWGPFSHVNTLGLLLVPLEVPSKLIPQRVEVSEPNWFWAVHCNFLHTQWIFENDVECSSLSWLVTHPISWWITLKEKKCF